MEIEKKDGSENTLPNGSTHTPKRGRGRPRGSVSKKVTATKMAKHDSMESQKVDYFSPENSKVKKRGRPKKNKVRGRPRKIPLTSEEEAERLLRLSKQRKRKLSKPLGRPRIHPITEVPKIKRGRGRPRKYDPVPESPSQNSTDSGDFEEIGHSPSVEITLGDFTKSSPGKRGRPLGSFKKRRGQTPKKVTAETPKKRGRPPSSNTEVKNILELDESPQKRGRPPGSAKKTKIINQNIETPKKRGRPPGIKITEQEDRDSPRKRGRPPGPGKIKVMVPEGEDVDLDICDNVDTCAPPRKRGRPSKVRLAVVLQKLPSSVTEEEDKVKTQLIDPPSPEQSHNSDSSPIPNESTAEDPEASENNGPPEGEEEEVNNTNDCPKVNDTSEKEIEEAAAIEVIPSTEHESSRKGGCSRMLPGKSSKKK